MTVNAPPSVVFRWLCQLKLAPYSYDLIDNRGRRSPQHLVPGVDQLVVGERVLIFELASFARDEHLTLVVRRHPVFGDVAISYVVAPRAGRWHSPRRQAGHSSRRAAWREPCCAVCSRLAIS